jgi:ribonuclease-3
MDEKRVHELRSLEKKLNLNFQNINLLDTALTHSSFTNEQKGVESNERLEFLGDAILQLCISEYLFSKFVNESEGFLTKKRALIVCGDSLFQVSQNWDIGTFIKMSKGEEMTGGRTRISILADCVEALIAAIYLDKGYENAKEFIINNFKVVIDLVQSGGYISDYKTKFQETIQKTKDYSICYNLVKFDGPPHRRIFYTEVLVDSLVYGNGKGYSKKEAEQNAAKEALKNWEVNNA